MTKSSQYRPSTQTMILWLILANVSDGWLSIAAYVFAAVGLLAIFIHAARD